MENFPSVSIITINYNQINVTREFLKSLSKLTYRNFEVIVIDNASLENHNSELKHEFPSARIYRTKENLGFTGGNNLGMKLSKGDYVLIINNDTEIDQPDFLQKLIEPFLRDSSIGMVSPKIKYFDHPEIIQFAGYNKINSFTGRNGQVGDGERDNGQYDFSSYTNYAHGAAMLVKKEVLEVVGVFSDQFFLCYEELDWSAQTVKQGYKIFYQAETYILHKESITMGKSSPMKVYFNNRNRILFMRRNTALFDRLCFFLYFSFFTIPKNVLLFLVRFQFEHLKSFINAIIWNIKNVHIYKTTPFITQLRNVSIESIEKSEQ